MNRKSNMPKSTSPQRSAFTLIEIVVVMGILALMIAILIPSIVVAHKRSQAETVLTDLRALDGAMHQYTDRSGGEIRIGRLSVTPRETVDPGVQSGSDIQFSDIKKYLKKDTRVFKTNGRDPLGNPYGPFTVGKPPQVPERTYEFFSGVVDDSYWSIYH